MSFRRIPKEIDPRRPPKRQRDHDAETQADDQKVDRASDEVAQLERTTEEVAREGESPVAGDVGGGSRSARRAVEAREAFEDATDEVSREDE
jgi:hypothetical protein